MFRWLKEAVKKKKPYKDYLKLCLNTITDSVEYKSICHNFGTAAEAEQFCNWFNNQRPFFSSQLRYDYRYNYDRNPKYTVSVGEDEFNFIWGKNSFSALVPNYEIADYKNFLSKAINNNDPKSIYDFKKQHRLNQKRILLNDSAILKEAFEHANVSILNALFNAFEKKVLNFVISAMDANKTLFDLAADTMMDPGFSSLLESVDTTAINEALSKSMRRFSALHYIAQKPARMSFFSLLSLVDSEILAESINTLDSANDDLLALLFLNHPPESIAKFLQRLAEIKGLNLYGTFTRNKEQLVEAMAHEASWQNTTFLTLFQEVLGESFTLALQKKISEIAHPSVWLIAHFKLTPNIKPTSVNPIAIEEKKESLRREKVLITTANNRQIVIDDMTLADSIWMEGCKSYRDYQNLLPLISSNKKLETILKTLKEKQKIYTGTQIPFTTYMSYFDEFRHPLHDIILNLAEDDFAHLICLIPKATLDQHIQEKSGENDCTALQLAAEKLTEKNFLNLIQSVHAVTLAKAIMLPNELNQNALHTAARYQSSDNFIALTRLSTLERRQNVQPSAALQDVNLATPFHIAALYQNTAGFMALCNTYSDGLQAAFRLNDNQDNTVFHLAFAHQNRQSLDNLFIALMGCSLALVARDPFILGNVLLDVNTEGNSILSLAMTHQSPDIAAELIRIMNNAFRHITLTRDIRLPHVLSKLVDSLLHSNSLWANEAIVESLFNIVGKQLTPLLCEYWLNGNELSPLLMNQVKKQLSDAALDTHQSYHLILSEIYNPWKQRNIQKQLEEKMNEHTFLTSKKTRLNINDANSIEILWREGLLDISHYRRLRKLGNKIPLLTSTLDKLYQSERILSGCYQALMPDTQSPIGLPEVNQLIDSDNAVIQMIRPDNWVATLDQLSDYQQRPPAFQPAADEKAQLYQYSYLLDKIEIYEPLDEKIEAFTHTAPMPVSFLGGGLNTNLLSAGSPLLPSVGIFYKRDHCVVKAMATTEVILEGAAWIGTMDQVKTYADKIKPFVHFNEKDFSQAIQKHPYQVNFMLAELSHEGAFGIGIVDDTVPGRALARTMAEDFRLKFNRTLPVIFYRSATSSIRMYLPEEMEADRLMEERGVKVNLLVEREAEARLRAFKADILAKKDWLTYSMFGLKRGGEALPKKAAGFVKSISDAENKLPFFWTTLHSDVARNLEATIGARGYGREGKTQEFYEDAFKRYFN